MALVIVGTDRSDARRAPEKDRSLYRWGHTKEAQTQVMYENRVRSDANPVSICLIELEVETAALDGVGTDFAVGYGHVVGVDCIALEGLFALQCAVEHYVCV